MRDSLTSRAAQNKVRSEANNKRRAERPLTVRELERESRPPRRIRRYIKNPARSDLPAQFIDDQDRIVLELVISIYNTPIPEKDGWVLQEEGTTSVRYWLNGDSAIVGIMGTSAKGGVSNLLDDAAIAGIGNGACSLSVVDQAAFIIEKLSASNIVVAGHSLGGAGALCIAKKYSFVRAVTFNGAAPPTGGPVEGSGRDKCRAYHIVGDIISTHVDSNSILVSRIDLGGSGDIDWVDTAFYHSSDRFFTTAGYSLWGAQREQDNLVDFMFNDSPTSTLVTMITGLISEEFSPDRIKDVICKNPIPGTNANCPKNINIGRIVATGLAAAVGGFFGGPVGALSAASLAHQITSGKGLIDIVAPGAIPIVKEGAVDLITAAQNTNRTLTSSRLDPSTVTQSVVAKPVPRLR